ncbi:UNVERIFIED_ORG: hypothetical protein LHK14_01745 [Roseateles sp. XES5]|nr:hypothetical protein [Roseateles sp. XES5]
MTAPFLDVLYRFQGFACGLAQDGQALHRHDTEAPPEAAANTPPSGKACALARTPRPGATADDARAPSRGR